MAIYIKNTKRVTNILANVNGQRKKIVSAWVNRDGVPAKVFGLEHNHIIPVTANGYIAKSRGNSFKLIIPDKEEISCTATANDHISLSGNMVMVSKNAAVGSVIPVSVSSDSVSYTVNIIVAPDISKNSYEIYDSNDLVTLRTIVNNSAMNDVSQNARLMNDIDLSDVCSPTAGNWIIISEYHGIFDGQGHTINHLYMDVTGADYAGKYETYVGLFGKANGATIKNVTLNGSVTGRSGSTSKNMYVGGFCGSAKITQFENLTNNCSVYALYSSGAAIAAPYYAGGICGEGTSVKFVGCVNNGIIQGKKYSGGICGYGGPFTNCHNTGNVESIIGDAGGIGGRNGGVIWTTGCANTGTIIANSGVAGGIFASGSYVSQCHNSGNISSSRQSAGGIIGSGGRIDECYNNGEITASGQSSASYAGGIVGSALNEVKNSYNTGNVTGYHAAGGITGCQQTAYVSNCYSIGNYKVNDSGNAYGSIIGYSMNSCQLTNCYALTSRLNGGNANAVTKTNCESVSESILKTYAHKLGDKFTEDADGINSGFPILAFQTT